VPRYFFNVHHERTTIDDEGEELPDMHEAWRAATLAAGEMIKEIDGELVPGREWRLEGLRTSLEPALCHSRQCRET
jgi:hypothetical protein